jgi:tetraacyldisaccharide-1-P 4'-kinase
MSAGGAVVAESAEPLNLIVLDDGLQRVAVRLLSLAPQHGYYDAEIVIRSAS